jgi:hypothetical protein
MLNRLVFVAAVAATLSACSTTNDKFEKRADAERERQVKYAERAIDKAPAWMEKVPSSDSAVYANGTSVSRDMEMARTKAKLMAMGKICMSAGGKVDQQSKVFMMDNESGGSELSETAIRSMCPQVDVTGVEIVDTRTIAEGTRFRSYVLVALPMGDANKLQARKDGIRARKATEIRAADVTKELDANANRAAE